MSEKQTVADKFLQKLKNNRVIAVLVVLGIVVVALGNVGEALDKIFVFTRNHIFRENVAPNKVIIGSPRPEDESNISPRVPSTSFSKAGQLDKPKPVNQYGIDRRDEVAAFVEPSASSEQKLTSEAKPKRASTEAEQEITNLVEASSSSSTKLETTPVTPKCADIESLKSAISAANSIYSSTTRDETYSSIISRALCSLSFEFAVAVADKMYSSTNRDEAYMEIIKLTIGSGRLDLANQIARKIYSSTQRDIAIRLIVDATAK